MIQWTDRNWRYFFRHISKHTLLYTEMINDQALIHNPHRLDDFIGHDSSEQPLVVQLGGSDPIILAKAAKICEDFGPFQAINLNCGCPSNVSENIYYNL